MFNRVFSSIKTAYSKAVEEYEEERQQQDLERKRKRSNGSLNSTASADSKASSSSSSRVPSASILARSIIKKRKTATGSVDVAKEEVIAKLEARVKELEQIVEERDVIIAELKKKLGEEDDEEKDEDEEEDNEASVDENDDKENEVSSIQGKSDSAVEVEEDEEQPHVKSQAGEALDDFEQLSPVKLDQLPSLMGSVQEA